MRKRIKARARHPAAELNITAFLNLMVVLVPFLLLTAVFSHITILDLNLPDPSTEQGDQPDTPPYALNITIREKLINLSDNRGGMITQVPMKDNQHQYAELKKALVQVKARLPDKTTINILAEPDTPYDYLIQVMDAARSYEAVLDGETVMAELFPDISIGEAPKQ